MKKSLLLLAALAGTSLTVGAQQLKSGYVTWPSSSQLHTYISAWNGGNGKITINGQTWEDENFFISRVKPKARVFNTATQIYPAMTQWSSTNKNGTDKRVIWWVPIGDTNRSGVNTNSLPNSLFDSETFSMWSYIDHWGNWTAPYGWVFGGVADVAHKNGVAMSGVASVPNSSIPSEWSTCFNSVTSLNSDAVGKFFLYHGVDGLGYNSEWSSNASVVTNLTTMHKNLMSYMNGKNPLWEVIWYGGTTDSGTCSFDQGLTGNTGIFSAASMFLNYNWNNTSKMTSSISTAENMGRSPFYIYAGMNQQGGEPKSGENYALLKDYKYSIGLWGAHNANMFWESRNANGSSPEDQQRTYLKSCQQWFGNGALNPAVKSTPTTVRNHRPTDDWAGISSMVSARTAIQNDITTEPFYTYFNLGNGKFMNWRGQRMNDISWYNIAVQDYLPTWRWWLSPTVRATDVTKGSTNLNVDFTWEDAYIGGSCLRITGTTSEEYLQLFKTQIVMTSGYRIRVYYKLLEGSADISLETCNGAGSQAKTVSILKKADSEAAYDKSYTEGWQKFEYSVVANWRSGYNATNKGMGILGLGFKNAENMDLLLGGIEIVPSATTSIAKPEAPTVTTAKVLSNNVKGLDAKLIWNMPNTKAVGEPCYNSDVNTAMFRMWFQQEGCDPVMMGLTTSWAGLMYQAPYDAVKGGNVRFGVSALPVDMDETNESTIGWSNYMSVGTYEMIEDITVDKTMIKPSESFTFSFVDPVHASATWILLDAQSGAEVWRGTGAKVTCPGLSTIGAYTLKVTSGTVTNEYPRYISVSSEAVGALPQIYSVSLDNEVVTDNTPDVTINLSEANAKLTHKFAYTGRNADGAASRGVDLDEGWVGVRVGDLGIQDGKSFSVAAWIKFNELPDGRSSLLTVEDRMTGGWPYNNWGFFWSRITNEGKFTDGNIDTIWGHRTGSDTEGRRLYYKYDDSKVEPGAWTHLAFVWDFKTATQFRQLFYINGVCQPITAWCDIIKKTAEDYFAANYSDNWSHLEALKNADYYGFGENISDPVNNLPYAGREAATGSTLTTATWIAFGGTSQNITGAKGSLDDLQVWYKAMTPEEVKQSMEGLDKNNLPADVIGYWDFEDEPVDGTVNYSYVKNNRTINSSQTGSSFEGYTGSNATYKKPKAYHYDFNNAGEGENAINLLKPIYLSGCPFISGTAYPIVTKPTWKAQRGEVVGDGTGESGSADITFKKTGDYNVELTLENGHGSDTKSYPVVHVVDQTSAIGDIAADQSEVKTFTVDGTLFIDFAQDGNYSIDVYNMAGMLAAQKVADIVAGQTASINLAQKGVYLVKIVRDGKLLRTVKILNK